MKTEVISECNVCSSNKLAPVDSLHNICQCVDCGFIFDNPRPTPQEIFNFYSKPGQYQEWISEIDERDLLWKRRLEKILEYHKQGSILDIGSGIGQFLHHAGSYFTHVSGTEVSDSAIAIAEQKYNLDLTKGTIEEIDFGDQRFDNISMFHVLEHVHDPKSVIKKCFNLLNDRGILFIAVPNEINCWKSRLSFIKKIKYELKSAAISTNPNGNQVSIGKWGLPKLVLDGSITEIHMSHFTPKVLQKLLTINGFKVLNCSLDPFYVEDSLLNKTGFSIHSFMNKTLGVNLYDTIWLVAEKGIL